MTHAVVGVLGHVDHGKTALVHALTGIDTDRLPEEKRRGISIALGFAHLTVADGTVIDLIDMPGHERFVRTMVSGATGLDAALLVVAANEGIKPQSVEHVEIAGLLGLRRAVVAITKCDLVPPETVDAAAAAVAALVRRVGLEAPPAIAVSAVDGTGLDALRTALGAIVQTRSAVGGCVFLPIDRAFSVAGHGTVVTGTLRGAAVAPGDELALWPGERRLRVRAVQVRGVRVVSASPGQRVALNLRDAELHDGPPGSSLAAPGSLAPSAWLTVSLRALESAPPLANGARLRALVGTTELDIRLRLLDRDVLDPGDTAPAQLRCAEPVALPVGEHVILRLNSPTRTVAGGSVIETAPVRRRRRDATVLARLQWLATATPAEIVAAEIERAGQAGTTLGHLARLVTRQRPWVAGTLAERDVVIGRNEVAVTRAALAAATDRLRALLAEEDDPVSREQVLARLPDLGRAVMDEALARLVAAGAVKEARGGVAIRRPDVDRQRAGQEAALRAELAEALRRAGLTPPDAAALAAPIERKRALDRLVREGVVVRAPDPAQQRVVWFHQDAIDDARRRLQPLLARPPGLLVSEVGAALGISRKYSVPLLEHLDQIRFTRRVQDRRILNVA